MVELFMHRKHLNCGNAVFGTQTHTYVKQSLKFLDPK